jgi:uncharacterized protein YprB with RNaseH-like and TPR domain
VSDKKDRADVASLRDMLRRIENKSKDYRIERPAPVVLEEALSGRVVETAKGPFYMVELPAEEFLAADESDDASVELFFGRAQRNAERLSGISPALRCLAAVASERMLFLDIETTGFHGTSLFLVGLMTREGGRFALRQLFARNYAEEAAVVAHLAEYYDCCDVVLTFNGRSFDLPFITDRAIVHRVNLPEVTADVDLLHAARRVWKDILPNCRLVTLEQMVCGRRRTGDLPSHLIPQAYHDYVQTGDARLMVDVIRHNAYDLVTMAHLLAKMANG